MYTLSHRIQDAQQQVNNNESTTKRTGILINPMKTKSMRINANIHDKLLICGTYKQHLPTLVSIVSYTGSTVEEIADRRKKLSTSLSNALACLEKSYAENQHKEYKYNAMSMSATWRETTTSKSKFQIFVKRFIRNIIGICWPEKIPLKSLEFDQSTTHSTINQIQEMEMDRTQVRKIGTKRISKEGKTRNTWR